MSHDEPFAVLHETHSALVLLCGGHATRHAELALRHLAAGTIRLALVGGLPGTGKSTVARELARETGAIPLSSDRIREGRRAQGVLAGESGTYGLGAYRPTARAEVYAVLRAEARTLLEAGRSVVLDAGWTDAAERDRAARLAADTAAELIELQCTAPQSVAAERIASRPGGDSEATPEIATAMAADRAPWPGAVSLDTTGPLSGTVRTAVRTWHGASPPAAGAESTDDIAVLPADSRTIVESPAHPGNGNRS